MRRFGVLGVALAVCASGVLAVALPAAADPVTVQPGSAACSAVLTVVPTDIYWGPSHAGDWWEGGTVTEVGSCAPGATAPMVGTGTWQRYGGGRSPVTGQCPPAEFVLKGRNGGNYYEITDESSLVDSPQILGLNYFYSPNVPIGTDSFSERVPTGLTLAHTDAAACAAWPTTSAPPANIPAPAPFHIELYGVPAPTSLLQACVTVQGVLPRTCVNA